MICFLIASMIAYCALVFYANRAAFTSSFDANYWKDRYEQSQWQLPVSTRTIGDDGLYLYEGWRVIKGDDPTTYNAEVPPLGKYLIGTSILLFNNGNWYGLIVTTFSIIAFFFLAKLLLQKTVLSLILTLLFLTDPLLTSQFPLTMLDSLQTFFAISTMAILIFVMQNPQKQLSVVLLGISFGLLAATKAPIFSPWLGLIIAFSLLATFRRVWPMVIFCMAAGITYLIPYIPYFLMGHTFGEWLDVQKWILSVYRSTSTMANPGSALTTLLLNRYQNIFTKMWEPASMWSLAWPIITITAITGWITSKDRRVELPAACFVFIMLIVLSFTSFWIRYLLPILPFLYLGAFTCLMQRKKMWVVPCAIILLGANLYSSTNILFPTPEKAVKEFAYAWTHGFFQDMYEQLASSAKTTDRASFHRLGLQTLYDGQIEAATIEIIDPHWSRFQSPQNVALQITYFTRELGPLTEHRTISVVNQQGKWVLLWKWSDLLEGFDETKRLATTNIPARRGSIISADNQFLAHDLPGFMVWVTPKDVDGGKENDMLAALEEAFGRHPGAVSIHHRYVGNTLPDIAIPIGTLRNQLQQFPGISYTPHFVRVASESGTIINTAYKECCSLLYSTTNYDGISGLEKEYNNQLKGKNGGQLVIKDQTGSIVRTILDLPKQDGNDVVLNLR